jgi:hypothetical protein
MNMFDINFLIQTTLTAVVLLSMAFRIRGNYLVHVVTMTAVVILGFVVLGVASPLFSDSSYVETLMNPTMNLATFVSHAFFGLASLGSGTILVGFLLRDRAIPARSNLIAKTVSILWVLAYAIGVLFFVILHVL